METRQRSIVKRAAKLTKTKQLRHWFLADERGTWQRYAVDYLDKTAQRAAELGLTEPQVDEEIAKQLVVLGLTSMIRDQESRPEKPKRGRK